MTRPNGLYWVVQPHPEEWSIAELRKWEDGREYWIELGVETPFQENDYYHIGPMVVESILQYKSVTKEELAAGYVANGKTLPYMARAVGQEMFIVCWPEAFMGPVNQHGPAAGYK